MGNTRRKPEVPKTPPRQRRATTPEARENQIINMSYDLAEQQIREGTVSAQVHSHFLKMGSSRERAEQKRLAQENELLAAKVKTLESNSRIEALYEDAIAAMKGYTGQEEDDYYE